MAAKVNQKSVAKVQEIADEGEEPVESVDQLFDSDLDSLRED